jgi:hypothetical protein
MDAIAELVETVSFDELVHHLGELPHKLDRFIDAGVIAPNDDGRFLLEQAVAAKQRFVAWPTDRGCARG